MTRGGDPLQVGVLNMMQNPTGIVAGAANPAMDPTTLSNGVRCGQGQISAYICWHGDATKGRAITLTREDLLWVCLHQG